MNKKVKSLLVAGLLVVGMSGNTFANGGSGAGESTSTPVPVISEIINPEFKEGNTERTFTLQDEAVTVTIKRNEDDTYDIKVSWDSDTVNVTGLRPSFANGTINSDNLFDEKYFCNLIKPDGDRNSVTIQGLGGKPGETFEPFGELTKVEIRIEAVKGDKPTEPDEPTEPEDEKKEEIKDEIATGDASSMPLVATAVISAAGLYVLSKKEDE